MTETSPQPEPTTDFDGCARECRKAGVHTRRWGGCEHATPPEPTVSMSVVYTDPADGYPSIGFDTYTVLQLARLIEPVIGDPLKAAAVARAIVHRHDVQPAAAPVPAPAPTDQAARTERYAVAIHDAMESDLSLVDQEPAFQALFARAAEAAVTVADAEQADLRRERDLAIAHDRQPYPTAWAYEQACNALNAHREKAETRRLALSQALGLGTGAPWETIRNRAVELAAVVPAPADRAAILHEAATAAVNGDIEFNMEAAEAALKNAGLSAVIAYVQLGVSQYLRGLAGGAQQGTTSDRAAVLREAADAIEEAQHRRDDIVNDALGFLDNNTEQQHIAVHRSGRLLRRMAGEAQQQPDTEHVCKPGAGYYYCPTSAQVESDCHGGFDTCCSRPDLHLPAAAEQQPAPLRAELTPFQLLADQPDEPLPQTERVIGGRRLGTTEQQPAADGTDEEA